MEEKNQVLNNQLDM